MDTSEAYIKMCQKAREIQHERYGDNGVLREWADGDWFIGNIFIPNSYVVCTEEGQWPLDELQGYVWLPRQDQLQEMVSCSGPFSYHSIQWLRWCVDRNWVISDYAIQFKTREQLWLAYVMWEKYHKKWDGEAWREADA